MKKTIAFLLAAVMVLTVAGVAAFAEENPASSIVIEGMHSVRFEDYSDAIEMSSTTPTTKTATITAKGVQGNVGDIVGVDVCVSALSDIGTLDLLLNYDTAYLAPATVKDSRGNDVYFTTGAATTEASGLVEGNHVDDSFVMNAIAPLGYYEEGVIATVYFKILKVGSSAVVPKCTTVGHYMDTTVTYSMTMKGGTVLATSSTPSVESSEPEVSGQPVTPAMIGDVNGNGDIDAGDGLKVLQCAVGKIELTDIQLVSADVNGDDVINAEDALIILKKVVKLIDTFPVEG